MADTIVRKVLMQLTADDADAAAKLEAIKAKADELREMNPELTARINTAEASAKVAVFRDELKAAGAERVTPKVDLQTGEAEGKIAMLRGQLASLNATGAAAGAGGIPLMAVGITALIGAAAAALPAVLAVGGAVGAFGMFAVPAIKGVSSAYQQIQSDQQAYDRALTATAKNNALKHLQQDLAALSPAQRDVIGGIQQVKSEFDGISKALQPQMLSVFGQALKIVTDLLPKLAPLAQAGAGAVSQVLTAVGSAVSSPQFSQFVNMMAQLAGPATSALTGLGGTIGGILVNALEQLAPYSVPFIQMLQGLLSAAGPALGGGLKFLAQVLIDLGDALAPVVRQLAPVLVSFLSSPGLQSAVKALADGIGKVAIALMPLVTDIAQIAGSALGKLAPVISQVAGAIAEMIAKAPPQVIQAIAGALVGMAAAAALMNLNPWVLAITAVIIGLAEIVHYWPQISAAFETGWRNVVQWTKVAADFITHTFDDVRHWFAHVGDDIARPFEIGFDAVKGWLNSFGNDVQNFFTSLPGKVTGGLNSFGNVITGFFRQLFNWISGGISQLYDWMVQGGYNIIVGIWNGLVKGFNGFVSGIGSLGKMIANALLGVFGIHFNSPPSEAVYAVMAGQRIQQGIAKGLAQDQALVTAGMARTNAAISAGPSGAAGSRQQPVVIQLQGDAALRQWLKKSIRVTGGQVSVVGA